MKTRFLAALSLMAALILCLIGATAELPDSLQEIQSSAFDGDTALQGVLTLPESVRFVGSRAFAGTGLHALIVPEICGSLPADVLAGGDAAYVTFNGTGTTVASSALTDVSYVFAPAGSAVSSLTGFYAAEDLYVQDGFFFSMTQEAALPLCAVDGSAMTGSVSLPKLVDELPVRQLDTLVLRGCEDAQISVPSYLTIPEGMAVTTYDAMTITTPVSDVTECLAGDSITWTTQVSGAYGDVSYIWYFDINGTLYSIITATPTVTWTPEISGLCIASVTAVDALQDRAMATAAAVTVGEPIPVYRALLVGNTYPGTESELAGCDTDAYAMRTMLNSMTETDYSVTVQLNMSASGMQSAIASTFANARSCDVSLFYFSGHGTSAGSLVGVGNSAVSVGALRAWLDAIPGTKIVIIDCCYSGMMIGKSTDAGSPSAFTSAFISGFSTYTKANNLANNGFVVMTACSKDQISQSLTDSSVPISFGAFTYGVCYGSGYDEWNRVSMSSMSADTDGNGQITLGEAYEKAVDRVSWLSDLLAEAGGGTIDQSAQYYGDADYVLWAK